MVTSTLRSFVIACSMALALCHDYCAICADHTMCKYRGQSEACGTDVLVTGVNGSSKGLILQLHNAFRNNVALGYEKRGSEGPQPPAANMRKMYWDDEIAAIAQRWIEQCDTSRYDECRDTAAMAVAQNGFSWSSNGYSSEPDWETALNAWFDTVQSFSNSNIDSFHYPSRGYQYSLTAWANTYLIGCGYVSNYLNGKFNKLYICNYGPAGNIDNEAMYVIGDPCSQCNSKCDEKYTGLCV